ncbi:ATP-dependent DNA helicase [Trichonephila inaurata madagascariensis]|uniref:ATP-dependent DNA helicase n=1 Tax=Trichonephila inaurata madagascariensis TaxID=2747483 RepID=A0A8X7CB91_9ARAC|nr:ATP-dependent DNA helicase [Trichonephila inaurata madagascariensis]
MRNRRAQRTDEQIQQNNEDVRVNTGQLRESQSQEARAKQIQLRRLEQRQARRFVVDTRRQNDQQCQQVHRAFTSDLFHRLAFEYRPDIKYYALSNVGIGAMDKECPHSNALKFKNEPAGIDNHAIVINPDKTPAGEHIRRFNAPVVDDIAGIIDGDRTATREIVIRRRKNNLEFTADTHRSYDALQYPLMFWQGQDGYCINIKQRDPVTGAETNKNVSSKDYGLMIRRGQDNVILHL